MHICTMVQRYALLELLNFNPLFNKILISEDIGATANPAVGISPRGLCISCDGKATISQGCIFALVS
jgi:hypothetical protein